MLYKLVASAQIFLSARSWKQRSVSRLFSLGFKGIRYPTFSPHMVRYIRKIYVFIHVKHDIIPPMNGKNMCLEYCKIIINQLLVQGKPIAGPKKRFHLGKTKWCPTWMFPGKPSSQWNGETISVFHSEIVSISGRIVFANFAWSMRKKMSVSETKKRSGCFMSSPRCPRIDMIWHDYSWSENSTP